jgi:protein-L-isoaspartate(D-aspartate) O-methyltransferase
MDIEQARFNMIEQQIRPWDVFDPAVLALLAVVRREDFVPPALRALAFADTEVPLPEGERMLTPKVEARLLQAAQVQRHERVLEIGTGSGFMAALLAHRAQQVITLERRPALAALAGAHLRQAGVQNVRVLAQDGRDGLPDEAPFDVIMLSGSVAELPRALLGQLGPAGRLIGVVGDAPAMRALRVVRAGSGFQTTALFETVAPRLLGFAEQPRFAF